MNDDSLLVSRVIEGDARAFRQLVQQHERLVFHMVHRIVNRAEDSEDICQEVFMRVFQKIHLFQFQSKLSTWIATIAYRTALNYVKKEEKYTTDAIYDTLPIASNELSAQEMLERKNLYQHIHQQIALLPVHYRTVLTLYHLEEMSLQEIQAVTDMPEGTVKNYLFRARKLLKDQLQKQFQQEEL
uniref:RNA polymerase sigma factor n=1 Tax=Roseihalotalea indica TaxID=2867963 RepID=A0AA49JF87_9BACT|nr:RNA polymerase sigma factor [Tunicatimonas sp. TK19036]